MKRYNVKNFSDFPPLEGLREEKKHKQMKQTLLITALFLFCLSCSSDDDGGNGQQDDTQLTSGKWYYESNNGEEGDECAKISSIEFTTEGEFIIDPYGYSDFSDEDCVPTGMMQGTYTVSGNTISVNVFGVTASGTYSISNGILTSNGLNPFDSSSNNTTYDKTPG